MNNCFAGFYKRVCHHKYFILPVIVLTLLFSSCITTKRTSYFRTLSKDTLIKNFVTDDLELKIQKKDILAIIVSSLNKTEDDLFNAGTDGVSSTSRGFLVNEHGKILLHRLGWVTAEGLTRKELKEKLQKELLPYLRDPIVSVQFTNHKVIVFGDVGSAQIITMPEEQLSIFEVLVKSGDLRSTARRDNIMIIREEGNDKKVKHISLEDHSIFTSPWYWVKPNDIIYVTPDEDLRIRDEKRARVQTNIAFITSGITLLLFIVERITR